MNLTEQIVQTLLRTRFVPLEASGRHVHLSKNDAQLLFGHALTPKRALSQPGQYVCHERVTLVGSKGEFANVAVLGPERGQSQVELSMTDCVSLGLAAPVRLSGELDGSTGITIRANGKELRLERGAIIAQRHIHMTPADAQAQGVRHGDVVKLRCLTARPTIFEQVAVRVSPDFCTFAHLDYDEANACGFVKGDLGMIVRE